MSDPFCIDSHKLLYHPERVAAWRAGENIAPLYMEISPSGACNHRCRFCGLDFMEYRPRFLDAAVLMGQLPDMRAMGLKSIMYAGEGEPFLNRDMGRLALATKAAGIDLAFTTNAVLLKPALCSSILPHTTWIKASVNAGSPETYAAIHRTRSEDFDRVMDNLAAAVRLREENGLACTLGVQSLLLPENQREMTVLARRCRDIGLDYLVVKPYSQHPASITREYAEVTYGETTELATELAKIATPAFAVVFRARTMQKWQEQNRPYRQCLALPFWSYIDAGGGVWGCSVHLGDERFLYGNINSQSFREIWESTARRQSLAWVAGSLDAAGCRVNCRMDEINRYLWELGHPGPHVNFI